MSTKGGIIVVKKEMTKLWLDGKFVPVTLVQVPSQEIVRYKTQEKDGYVAVVVGEGKTETKKEKGQKVVYSLLSEFPIDDSFASTHTVGSLLDASFLEGITSVEVKGVTKGKGFQGAMKRFHLQGGPKTHGSKFHRHVGSMGNRKPRRTMKGHPHAGHMGSDAITLKHIQVVDLIKRENEELVAVRGSLPGARNTKLKFIIE